MLFVKSNQGFALPPSALAQEHEAPSLAAVCGYGDADPLPDPRTMALAPMGYLFDRAPFQPQLPEDKVSRLAGAMANAASGSRMSPTLGALARLMFIDTCAPALRAAPIDGLPDKTSLPRPFLEAGLSNLRNGRPDLQAIYGGAMVEGPLSTAMRRLLRQTNAPACMRMGESGTIPVLADLTPYEVVKLAESLALAPAEIRADFLTEAGDLNPHAPLVADLRVVEDQGLTRLLCHFLKSHNLIGAEAGSEDAAGDPEDAFRSAQRALTLSYTTMLRNDFLPAICDPIMLRQAEATDRHVYTEFRKAISAEGGRGLPVAFEIAFAVLPLIWTLAGRDQPMPGLLAGNAASRDPIGYPGEQGKSASAQFIDLDVIFRGEPGAPRIAPETGSDPTPPAHGTSSRDSIRHYIALGQRLNLPCAEDCINAFQQFDIHIRPPEYAREMRDLGLSGVSLGDTPLFVYLWLEATVSGNGKRLGPLGSRLIAEHLLAQLREVESDLLMAQRPQLTESARSLLSYNAIRRAIFP